MQEDWRSRSYAYGDGRLPIEAYGMRGGGGGGGGGYPPSGLHELRCYSATHASSQKPPLPLPPPPREINLKKGKSVSGSSSSSKGGWGFSDPELQRKKRVASYKVYSVESKMKGSLRKSFRWLKDRCTHVVYGWW